MVDLVKNYVENRIQLLKLNLIGAIANVAAGMVSSFLLLVMGILILLMFSIALAFGFQPSLRAKSLVLPLLDFCTYCSLLCMLLLPKREWKPRLKIKS